MFSVLVASSSFLRLFSPRRASCHVALGRGHSNHKGAEVLRRDTGHDWHVPGQTEMWTEGGGQGLDHAGPFRDRPW